MTHPFGTTCKAIATTIALGIAVLVACILDESSRAHYPTRSSK